MALRIIGGALGSRPLRAPRGESTRPTSDRVREALFNIVGARVRLEGARVLDLYAGTGALALEAISRGAAHATLVEDARDALQAIRANVASLGVGTRVRVLAQSVERVKPGALTAGAGPFDLVFADPPYAAVKDGSAVRAVEALAAEALAPWGLLVLEHASRDETPALRAETGLVLEDARRYGDTALALYRREPPRTP
jgi:16S rRNA (guanine(966)-N(2))-methyltransferase RsmD